MTRNFPTKLKPRPNPKHKLKLKPVTSHQSPKCFSLRHKKGEPRGSPSKTMIENQRDKIS
ncbi:hypothetical protein V12B01_13250 [Vibrio splendidus 12B01]|nr:hypothetical protein V12B01_13250 [Vibrio splendidus 12B01]